MSSNDAGIESEDSSFVESDLGREIDSRPLRTRLEELVAQAEDDYNLYTQLPEVDPGLLKDLFAALIELFGHEGRLVRVKNEEGLVCVLGDTHGDFEASFMCIEGFIKGKGPISQENPEKNHIVFLGDYVDRDPDAHANLMYLLIHKFLYPDQIVLIMGNHEAFGVVPYSPAEWWFEMNSEYPEWVDQYQEVLLQLPYGVDINENTVGVHASLPLLPFHRWQEIIPHTDDRNWRRLVWGDFSDERFNLVAVEYGTQRAAYSHEYFETVMDFLLERNLMIRGHDYRYKGRSIFKDRCYTLFSSRAYSSRGATPGRQYIVLDGKTSKSKSTSDWMVMDLEEVSSTGSELD